MISRYRDTSRCHINSETFSLQVNMYDSTRLKDNSEGLGMWNSWSKLPNCSQSVRGTWSCFSIPVSSTHDTTREWTWFGRFWWLYHPSGKHSQWKKSPPPIFRCHCFCSSARKFILFIKNHSGDICALLSQPHPPHSRTYPDATNTTPAGKKTPTLRSKAGVWALNELNWLGS